MAHHCTFAYPTAADFEMAAPNVIAFILGTDPTVDMACAAHCGYVVQGYLQGLLLPHDGHPPVMAATAGGKACHNKADVASGLQALLDQHKQGTRPAMAAAAAGFDWSQLIAIFGPMLLQWLADLLKPKTP